MKQSSLVTALLIAGCFGLLPVLVQAQLGRHMTFQQQKPKPPKPPKPNKGAPFDGGLSLLIAAGAVYTAKKAHDKMKMERLSQLI